MPQRSGYHEYLLPDVDFQRETERAVGWDQLQVSPVVRLAFILYATVAVRCLGNGGGGGNGVNSGQSYTVPFR
jgi:hypothetical protein